MSVDSEKTMKIKPKTMSINKEDLKIIVRQIIDFRSLALNGYSIHNYFEFQNWMPFFEMLNGPTYT